MFISDELKRLESEGFGVLLSRGSKKGLNRETYFKPCPQSVPEGSTVLHSIGMPHEKYTLTFNDIGHFQPVDWTILKQFHPQIHQLNLSHLKFELNENYMY